MQKSTTNGIIVVAVVVLAGLIFYKKFIPTQDSKKTVIGYLDSLYGKNTQHEIFVETATKSYIEAWAKAIKNGESTFVDGGKTYVTAGGKAKQ